MSCLPQILGGITGLILVGFIIRAATSDPKTSPKPSYKEENDIVEYDSNDEVKLSTKEFTIYNNYLDLIYHDVDRELKEINENRKKYGGLIGAKIPSGIESEEYRKILAKAAKFRIDTHYSKRIKAKLNEFFGWRLNNEF